MRIVKQEKRTSVIWRGRVLDAISDMEYSLNYYIATHFCGENNINMIREMILTILGDDRMSLGAKAQVFYAIAPRKHNKWYNDYNSIRIPDKGKKPYSMNSDLVWVIEQRNIFAHRLISHDTTIHSNKPSTQFIQYKNQITPFLYYKSDFEELMNVIKNLTERLDNEIY